MGALTADRAITNLTGVVLSIAAAPRWSRASVSRTFPEGSRFLVFLPSELVHPSSPNKKAVVSRPCQFLNPGSALLLV
jgi:hypothetical protein